MEYEILALLWSNWLLLEFTSSLLLGCYLDTADFGMYEGALACENHSN